MSFVLFLEQAEQMQMMRDEKYKHQVQKPRVGPHKSRRLGNNDTNRRATTVNLKVFHELMFWMGSFTKHYIIFEEPSYCVGTLVLN